MEEIKRKLKEKWDYLRNIEETKEKIEENSRKLKN